MFDIGIFFQNPITLDWEQADIHEDEARKAFAITYDIADIRIPTKSGGTRSTTLKLPGTGANDAIFFQSYTGNLAYRDDTTETSMQTVKTFREVRVYDGSTVIFSGKAQVNGAGTVSRRPEYYEVVLFAETASWMTDLDTKYLSDIDWGADITWEQAEIEDSWDEDADTFNYASFPVNYGKWTKPDYVSVGDMRPHVYWNRIIKGAFDLIGWNF